MASLNQSKKLSVYEQFCDALFKGKGTEYYSPNNIKRLIISPDGVLIYYHVPVKGHSCYKKLFNSLDLRSDYASGNYKCMIEALGNYVHYNIEEIIFLVRSVHSNGAIDCNLRPEEYNSNAYAKIALSGKASGDAKTVLDKHIKRLRYFTVSHTRTFNEVLTVLNKNLNSSYDFLTETPLFQNNAEIRTVLGEDWKIRYDLTSSAYEMDKKDGVLDNHFKSIKAKYEKSLKDADKAKFIAEKNKDLIKNVERYNIYTNGIIEAIKKLHKAVETCGSSGLVDINCFHGKSLYQSYALIKCDSIKVSAKNIKEEPNKSETDRLKENLNTLKLVRANYMKGLNNAFISSLINLHKTNPLTVEVILKSFEGEKFYVTQEYMYNAKLLEEFTKTKFITDSPNTSSIAMILSTIYTCFIDSNSDVYDKKYRLPETWKEMLKC